VCVHRDAGEPRCPFAAKTALVIAIAKTAPSQPAHWAAGERVARFDRKLTKKLATPRLEHPWDHHLRVDLHR